MPGSCSKQSQYIWDSDEFKLVQEYAKNAEHFQLRDLLKDPNRFQKMSAKLDRVFLDYSRQRIDDEGMRLLFKLAEQAQMKEKLNSMMSGEKLNVTENRSVLHTALRSPKEESLVVDGVDVIRDVHTVLKSIDEYSKKIRGGEIKGVTGKPLTNVISVGIGGSYLGPEFVYEALRFDAKAHKGAAGRTLRFAANVDPVDIERSMEGLDPEETLVVIVSKTFTTSETMLNARSLRQWLFTKLSNGDPVRDKLIVSKHMCAVSTNIPLVSEFGIDPSNVFGFWDWVGGRYSVCSAVGMLPLSIHFGYEVMSEFLKGAHDIDVHTRTAPFEKNIPVILGLIGVWNSTFLGFPCRALLPYSQSLTRFAAHIQQVDMESNGKRVTTKGDVVPFSTGEVNFGEPGTNGQHSFYQLIHQGRVIPCDFIGFKRSQLKKNPFALKNEEVDNHDELMSNFFAQPDALAMGLHHEELKAQHIDEKLIEHKYFSGNRPSSSLLFDQLDAYTCGMLLAIYEHRTVVQGFMWSICSFDQWGVELGKVLAKEVRKQISQSRSSQVDISSKFNVSTQSLLKMYLE